MQHLFDINDVLRLTRLHINLVTGISELDGSQVDLADVQAFLADPQHVQPADSLLSAINLKPVAAYTRIES